MGLRLRIQDLARARGYSMGALQRRADIAMGTMRRYWYGTADGRAAGPPIPNLDMAILEAIARALNVSVGELIDTGCNRERRPQADD